MEAVLDRARQFRGRAADIREVASGINDSECRQALTLLANRYDQMAERLENSERENETV